MIRWAGSCAYLYSVIEVKDFVQDCHVHPIVAASDAKGLEAREVLLSDCKAPSAGVKSTAVTGERLRPGGMSIGWPNARPSLEVEFGEILSS